MELNNVLFPAPKSTYTLSSPIANNIIFIPRNFHRRFVTEFTRQQQDENLNSHYSKNHMHRHLNKYYEVNSKKDIVCNLERVKSSFEMNQPDSINNYSQDQDQKQLNTYKSVNTFQATNQHQQLFYTQQHQFKQSMINIDTPVRDNEEESKQQYQQQQQQHGGIIRRLSNENNNNNNSQVSPNKKQSRNANIQKYDEFDSNRIRVMAPPISRDVDDEDEDDEEFNLQIEEHEKEIKMQQQIVQDEYGLMPKQSYQSNKNKTQVINAAKVDKTQINNTNNKVLISPQKKSINQFPKLKAQQPQQNHFFSQDDSFIQDQENNDYYNTHNANNQNNNDQSDKISFGKFLDDDILTLQEDYYTFESTQQNNQNVSSLLKQSNNRKLSESDSKQYPNQSNINTNNTSINNRRSRLKQHKPAFNSKNKHSTNNAKGSIPCLYLPCEQGSSKVLIYFHGNAEDVGIANELMEYVKSLLRVHVIAVEYPGYGLYKTSTPDANQVMNDAESVFSYITEYVGIPESSIILFGRSIGSGPATYIASQNKICALLLLAPFTSIRDMAKQISGRMLQFLVNDRFRNIDLIQKVKSPTFILHGQKDQLVPLKQSEDLHYRCGGPCALITPKDMDHNNFDYINDLITPFNQFLRKSNISVTDYNKDGNEEDGFMNGQIQFEASLREVPEEFQKCKIGSGSIWNWVIRKFQRQ